MANFGECLALYHGEHWRTWRNLESMKKFGEHGECLALYHDEHGKIWRTWRVLSTIPWRTWRNLENMEKFREHGEWLALYNGEHGKIWRGKPTKWAQPFNMPIGPLYRPNNNWWRSWGARRRWRKYCGGGEQCGGVARFPKKPKDKGSGSNCFNPPTLVHSPHSALAHLLPRNRRVLSASPSCTLL